MSIPAFTPCPFCGEIPEVEGKNVGSSIDIMCCVVMSIQKCDVLTLEERGTWDGELHRYSLAAEQKALVYAASVWNKRY